MPRSKMHLKGMITDARILKARATLPSVGLRSKEVAARDVMGVAGYWEPLSFFNRRAKGEKIHGAAADLAHRACLKWAREADHMAFCGASARPVRHSALPFRPVTALLSMAAAARTGTARWRRYRKLAG